MRYILFCPILLSRCVALRSYVVLCRLHCGFFALLAHLYMCYALLVECMHAVPVPELQSGRRYSCGFYSFL